MVHEILEIGLIDRRLMGKIEKIMQEQSYDRDWWRGGDQLIIRSSDWRQEKRRGANQV